MWRLRLAVLLYVAWTIGFVGCGGGSGSSGFDAIASENAAIETALATGRCVRSGQVNLLVCPLAPDLPENAAGGPVVRSPEGVTLDCAPATGVCTGEVQLEFAEAGSGTVGVLGLRKVGSDGPWQILGPIGAAATPAPVSVGFTVSALDAGGALAPGDLVQVAVLLFRQPVTGLPRTTPTLSATGAYAAFVAAPTQASASGDPPPR
jgi:hypothetical protein